MPETLTLAERLRSVFSLDPAAPLLHAGERTLTWGAVDEQAAAVEALLDALGAPERARIGVILRNQAFAVVDAVAILRSDRCLVTLNGLAPDGALCHDITGAAPQVVIAARSDLDRPGVRAALEGIGAGALVHAGDDVLVAAKGSPDHGLAEDDVVIEILTSGTTGTPKRIALGGGALVQAMGEVAGPARARPARLSTGVAVIFAPLVHASGIWHLVDSLAAGRQIVLLEKFDPHLWADAVARFRPRIAGLPPTAMRMVLDAGIEPAALASLEGVRVGTAPLPVSLADEFYERFSVPPLAVYGATEFAGSIAGWTVALHRSWGARKRGSVGKVFDGIDITVEDESGAPMPAGAAGRLMIRGSQLGTSDWVRTNDIGLVDADGFLWIEGRADDAIIRGGFKVSAGAVARVLESHPAVREAAVIGLADDRLGQVPVAAVELRTAASTTPEELEAFARTFLIAYQVPAAIRIVEALPRSDSMKVSAQGLRRLFERGEHGSCHNDG